MSSRKTKVRKRWEAWGREHDMLSGLGTITMKINREPGDTWAELERWLDDVAPMPMRYMPRPRPLLRWERAPEHAAAWRQQVVRKGRRAGMTHLCQVFANEMPALPLVSHNAQHRFTVEMCGKPVGVAYLSWPTWKEMAGFNRIRHPDEFMQYPVLPDTNLVTANYPLP